MESEVTDKLEEALNTISGIEELRWTSTEGTSQIFLSFNLEKGVDVAAQEVRDKVNLALSRMPEDVEQPIITKIDPGATPALFVAVNGDRPLREMTQLADDVVRSQIAALAIPISIIGTFALMWLQGFTLNTITLLAPALAVGIVIDDAIVVLENIFRFVNEKQMSPSQAAIEATREIGLAVLATTLSLLAVFLPVAFMGGIVGRFLHSFGLTMAYAIGISLFVSFTLTPMLASKWLDKARPIAAGAREQKRPLLERVVDTFYLPIERGYMLLLGWVMQRRWVVVVACVAAVAATVPLLGAVKKGFLPETDEAHFEINVRAAEGTNLEGTALIAERIARETRLLPGVPSPAAWRSRPAASSAPRRSSCSAAPRQGAVRRAAAAGAPARRRPSWTGPPSANRWKPSSATSHYAPSRPRKTTSPRPRAGSA